MQIIASDILADLCSLSLGLILLIVPVGLVLWLLGWWSHRFWIVLTVTVLAGIFGLTEATTWRAQPIVVAVLLAIAAGVMALALVRVIAFVSSGIAGLYFFQMVLPTWNQPVILFLLCGLLSLLLFRWCFMALTSFLGSALLIGAALALVHYHELLDVVAWSDDHRTLLNWTCGVVTLMGFLCQFLLNRRQMRRRKEEGEGEDSLLETVLSFVSWQKKSDRHAA